MAARGTRKRAAPGSSPQIGTMQNDYGTPANPDSYLWNNNGDATFGDSSDTFGANMYSALQNQNYDIDPSQSNQLTRRNMQNAVAPYANNNDQWGMDSAVQQGGFPWEQTSDEDKIDEQAREAKDSANKTRKSIPPFVMKLRSYLDEDKNTDLIRWSAAGDSFIVLDEEVFAKELIPELFKHSNYASFVRQLNMYGFHKQVGLSDNSMRASERKNKSPSEYKNPYFKKGKPEWMWLIQKPKPASRGKGSRAKNEEAGDEDEVIDGETPVAIGNSYSENNNLRASRPPMLLPQSSQSGQLAKEELVELHREIKTVRQQNMAIASIIQKMKQQQDQLNMQAQAFQEQHSRHENSINAILTFLATVYSRSLENHQGQDPSAIFTGAMAQHFQQHGTVVDVGDLGDDQLHSRASPGMRSRRQPLMLPAPPPSNVASTASPQAGRSYNQSNPNLRKTSSGSRTNPQIPANSRSGASGFVLPEDASEALSWINNANSKEAGTPNSQIDFGEALSQVQNRSGRGPLSASERNSMLEMMSNGNGSNAATPRPVESHNPVGTPANRTPVLDPQKMANITDDLETVESTLRNSQQSIDNIISRLSPMSPGGPDFSGQDYVPPPESGLNFDDMFNTDGYLNGEHDFGNLQTNFGDDNFNFDDPLGIGGSSYDGVNNPVSGRIESLNGSEATTPAPTIEEDDAEEIASPRKRRRRT